MKNGASTRRRRGVLSCRRFRRRPNARPGGAGAGLVPSGRSRGGSSRLGRWRACGPVSIFFRKRRRKKLMRRKKRGGCRRRWRRHRRRRRQKKQCIFNFRSFFFLRALSHLFPVLVSKSRDGRRNEVELLCMCVRVFVFVLVEKTRAKREKWMDSNEN